MTDEIIGLLKDAGCYEVRMGVESSNDYIRNKVYNRGMTKEELVKSFEIIKKHNLQLRLDFIYGAPYETFDMMEESLNFALQSNGDRIFFSRLYPFPGTVIKEICEKEHIFTKDFKFSKRGMPGVDRTKFANSKQIIRFGRKVSWWQMRNYISEGLSLNGLLFFWDVFIFLFYKKYKYDLELNQIYRWNVQKYRLKNLWT